MNLRPLTGTLTALVTPFRQGKVAYDDLQDLVNFQIKCGIDGLVPAGSTGESATLSHEEHMDVVRCVINTAAKRVPVVAGTGSNSTVEALDLTRAAHEAGADAMLVVAPYYNRPTQEGLYHHFAGSRRPRTGRSFFIPFRAVVASRSACRWWNACGPSIRTFPTSRNPAARSIASTS